VIAIVGAVDGVIGSHVDAVGAFEFTFAPGPEKPSITVEDRHGILPACEYIYVVMPIDADRSHVAEAPSVRKLAPVPSRACKPIAIAAFA
jgi:hypothetical protein